ncbi:unnamed protein product [Cylicostephanus goldi]|uniref:Uncharacterized protein n=1 Tax=Cylicostephanus goldi TaxID=71465 RepID=A0A3P6T602_CYLGO|nr:unnamed protein product [Cylicostephanus goldi]
MLGDRFAIEGLGGVIASTNKSLQTIVYDAIRIVQAASLLAIQSNANASVNWIYELASDAAHCGFDSVRLSTFQWTDAKDQDSYERKLLTLKGKDLEGAVTVSAVSRDGLICECIVPHPSGKLKAGAQHETSLVVTMQPKGVVETKPVQTDTAQKVDQLPEEGQLQLVTDEASGFLCKMIHPWTSWF